MKILYLAHRIPFPPDKGDKLRSFRQLEHLARRHQVWCACFVDNPADEQYVERLTAFCQEVAAVRLGRRRATWRGLFGLARGRTATESFYAHADMSDLLLRWSRAVDFDAVVAFSSSMVPCALAVPAGRRVLDLCDLDSRKWLDYAATSRGPSSLLYQAEGRRLAARERVWVDAFDATILITQAERDLLDGQVPHGRIHIVGNGVSLPDHRGDSWGRPGGRMVNNHNVAEDSPTSSVDPPVVGFVGVMNYRPNVDACQWFVRSCWGKIRRAHPNAIFRIIGHSPIRKVRQLENVPGVEVLGRVDDAAAEVDKLRVSVAPLRIARGLQNKVLEAMAAETPVVLTARAAEGIAGRDGREYLVANTPEEITRSVVRLLGDAEECTRIGKAARRFVAVNHCWEAELQKFELIVAGVLGPKTHPVELFPEPALTRTGHPVVGAV